MSKGVGQFVHLRLFIEGIEIPVNSASVSANVGAPGTANISILPDDAAFLFHPRSVVHLFYYDWEEAVYGGTGRSPTVGNMGGVTTAFSPVEDLEKGGLTIPKNDRGFRPSDLDRAYKLLFCGEVFAITYAKQGPGSRDVNLQCYDFSNLWDTYYLYTVAWSSPTAIAGSTENLFNATGVLDDIVSSAEEVIQRALSRDKPRNPGFGEVGETLGGLFSIIETIFGNPGKYTGSDNWITLSERRVRLLDQLGADSGKTAAALFKKTAFDSWLLKNIGQLGPLASVRDLIQLICSYTFYEISPNPVAVYTPGYRSFPIYDAFEDPALDGSLTTESFDDIAKRNLGNPVRGAFRITSKFGPRTPPITSFGRGSSYHRGIDIGDYGRTDHDVIAVLGGTVRGEYNAIRVPTTQNGRSGVKELKVTIDHGDGLTSTYRHLDTVAVSLGQQVAKGQFLGIIGDTGNSGAKHLHYELTFKGKKVDPSYYLNDNELYTKSDPTIAVPLAPLVVPSPLAETGITKEETEFPREKLLTQIFHPDIWFCAAPLCNVIFPSEYSAFNYSRQMMREVTRFQIETFNSLISSDDALLNRHAWAPKFADPNLNLAEGAIGSIAQKVVFQHEKFSGVIPKLDKISQLSYFSEWERANESGPGESTETTDEALTNIQVWADRVAHYRLLTERYMARSSTVNGRFMPRIICGFPAVVMGTETTYDLSRATQTAQTTDFDEQIARAARPIHFLGSVTSVNHTLSAEGQAFTTVVLSKVRSHKAGSDSDDPLLDRIQNDGSLQLQQVPGSEKQEPQTFDFGPDSSSVVSGSIASLIHSLLFEYGLGALFGTTDAEYLQRVGNTVAISEDSAQQKLALDAFIRQHPNFTLRGGGGGKFTYLRAREIELEKVRKQLLPKLASFKGPNGKPLVDFKFIGPREPSDYDIRQLLSSALTVSVTAATGRAGVPLPTGPVTISGQDIAIYANSAATSLWSAPTEAGADNNFRPFDPELTLVADAFNGVSSQGVISQRLYRVVPLFRGIIITESATDTIVSATKLPVEEAIRPAWISEEYSNTKISALYKRLFYCESVISKVSTPLAGFSMPSVEQAVDVIAAEFAEHPTGEDRARYVYDITKRGHADLLQVLGNKLEGDEDSGGFHFASVGPFENKEFLGLDDAELSQNAGTADTTVMTDGSIDPRKERRERVLRYLSRITLTRGFRG